MAKQYKLAPSDIQQLTMKGAGACIASDKITVDGARVGFMYREEKSEHPLDNGWRFLAGTETDEYLADKNNLDTYAINTIANFDPDILPLLPSPRGSAFMRVNGKFMPAQMPPQAKK